MDPTDKPPPGDDPPGGPGEPQASPPGEDPPGHPADPENQPTEPATRAPNGQFLPGNGHGRRNPPGRPPMERVTYAPGADVPPAGYTSPHRKRSADALKKKRARSAIEARRHDVVRLRVLGVPIERIAEEKGVGIETIRKDEIAWYNKEADQFNKPAEILRIAFRYSQLYTMAMGEYSAYNDDKIKRLRNSIAAGALHDIPLLEAALNERAEFRSGLVMKIAHILAYQWRAVTSVDVRTEAEDGVPLTTPGNETRDVYAQLVAGMDPAKRAELAARIRSVRDLVPGFSS